MLAHNEPDNLRADLQIRINAACQLRQYDMLILSYGLCGNATVGLTCPVKMIMPRVHDCCAVFMGSNKAFQKEFAGSLSMRWCTSGYYERCHKENGLTGGDTANRHKTQPEYLALVEQFGEDNAEYVWETMHPQIETPEAAYIKIPGFEVPGSEDGFRELVDGQGKSLRVVEGSAGYLRDLVNGPWDDGRFLTVLPGERICGVYDMDRVVKGE